MVYYMSKRETPLLEDDVTCILGLSSGDYHAALREGRLRRSIAIDTDPTGRLALHNFWDLLEFSLSTQLTKLAVAPDAAAGFAAQCCDDLAFDEHDLITITGDAETDYALAQHSWMDDPNAVGWPASLLDWCTRLLLQVGQHIHAVAAIRALGPSSRHVKGKWDQACAPVLTVITPHEAAEEPAWTMRQAA